MKFKDFKNCWKEIFFVDHALKLRLSFTCLSCGDLEKQHVNKTRAIKLKSKLSIFLSLNLKKVDILCLT